jgi:hypothetical protein
MNSTLGSSKEDESCFLTVCENRIVLWRQMYPHSPIVLPGGAKKPGGITFSLGITHDIKRILLHAIAPSNWQFM